MNKLSASIALGLSVIALFAFGCEERRATSDDVQRHQQETLLAEGTAQVGMPAIKNFRERKLLRDILELRDQAGLSTFTYVQSEMSGRLVFLCHSVGYGIPYATQFTNPSKPAYWGNQTVYTLPQADPNGLFSPAAADGTWVMCKDPGGSAVKPVFIEPRVVVTPFRLPDAEELLPASASSALAVEKAAPKPPKAP